MKLNIKKISICNPWLIALFFYKRDSTNEVLPVSLTFNLDLVKNEENHKTFKGDKYKMECLTYDDISVLRFSMGEIGEFSTHKWHDQREFLNKITQNPSFPMNNLLGSSILYCGLMGSLEDEKNWLTPPTITEFGNIWQQGLLIKEKRMEYILLTPMDVEEKTKKYFLFATDRGLIKVEKHFHKSNTEIMEYDEIRGELMGDIKELDEELITLLNTLRGQVIKKQREKLRILTPKYTAFVQMVSLVNKLKNTLRINIDNYKERLEILSKEKDRVYEPHIKRFEKSLAQIDHDLEYCQTTINSVNTGLDMLRGMNSISTRSRGVAIQAAMAVVETILVFYYSLGVWHLIIKEDKWKAISSIDKLMIGFGYAVFIPLGAHYFMERKWWRFGISIAMLVITVIYTVVITYIN